MPIDAIPFDILDEGFGHAVGFGDLDRSETAEKAHILGKRSCFCGGMAVAIVAAPFHPMREPVMVPKHRSTDSIIRSRPISPVMPLVVAT